MTSISTNPHSGPLARSRCLAILVAVMLSVLPAAAVRAQTADTVLAGSVLRPRPYPERAIIIDNDDRSGPRLGAAYLIGGSVRPRLNRKLAPLTTLFGWQVEHRFDTGPELPELLTEPGGARGRHRAGTGAAERKRVRRTPSTEWLGGGNRTHHDRRWRAARDCHR